MYMVIGYSGAEIIPESILIKEDVYVRENSKPPPRLREGIRKSVLGECLPLFDGCSGCDEARDHINVRLSRNFDALDGQLQGRDSLAISKHLLWLSGGLNIKYCFLATSIGNSFLLFGGDFF
jgi:hypothetical protein